MVYDLDRGGPQCQTQLKSFEPKVSTTQSEKVRCSSPPGCSSGSLTHSSWGQIMTKKSYTQKEKIRTYPSKNGSPTQNTKTQLTTERAEFIRANMEMPNEKISKEIDLSIPIIKMVKEAKRNNYMSPNKNRRPGVTPFRRKVTESENLFTVKQAQRYLSEAESNVRMWFSSGDIRAKKFKNVWLTRQKDLDEYKEAQDD